MNKKLFIGATALTAVAVAGYIRYRHVALEQLDSWLHPRVQDPEEESERLVQPRDQHGTDDG